MITLGYPDNIPNLSTRLPLEAVIHKNQYRSFSDSEIRNMYEERERFWELVGDARKKDLAKQGIHNIPQALAIQRFSDDVTRERSEKILENIRKAGFNFNA
jgi:dephospho-CoA kinase